MTIIESLSIIAIHTCLLLKNVPYPCVCMQNKMHHGVVSWFPCQSLVPYETTTIITDKFSFTLIGKLPTEATPPFSFLILLSVVQD